ncbi:hypothetical protein AB0M39_19910 [Streptomyces sp. NPDC051907]|uniref:hypothetical protein n=1 Tax=Streptomyces sp. NPDC051907 TaxID=3155284 RepID=UPI00341FBCFC
MTKLLLSIHVLAAILAVGPITVAASMFPRYARQAATRDQDAGGQDTGGEQAGGQQSGGQETGGRAAGIAAMLHRICTAYAVAGVVVPVFGIATAVQLDVLADAWLIVSLVLTAAAAGVLGLAVLPSQRRLLAAVQETDTHDASAAGASAHDALRPAAARLAMVTGVFNVLWAIVVVLMIVRPGSTTGA